MALPRNRVLLVASLALFVLAACLPAFGTEGGGTHGSEALAMGWLTLVIGTHVSWLANPAMVLAWVCGLAGRASAAHGLAGVSLVLMLVFFVQGDVVDAGGLHHPIETWKPGYFVWLASPVPLLGLRADAGRR